MFSTSLHTSVPFNAHCILGHHGDQFSFPVKIGIWHVVVKPLSSVKYAIAREESVWNRCDYRSNKYFG